MIELTPEKLIELITNPDVSNTEKIACLNDMIEGCNKYFENEQKDNTGVTCYMAFVEKRHALMCDLLEEMGRRYIEALEDMENKASVPDISKIDFRKIKPQA